MAEIVRYLCLMLVIIGSVAHLELYAQETLPIAEVVDSINNIENATTRYYHIDCADEYHCIVAGEVVGGFRSDVVDYAFIRGTTDGGHTWKYLKIDSLRGPEDLERWTQARRVAHPSPNLMLVATLQGILHRSDDGGDTWTSTKPYPDVGYLHSLNMYDSVHGVMMSGGQVLYTDNGGLEWQKIYVPDSLVQDSSYRGGVVYVNLSSPTNLVVSARRNGEGGYGCMALTSDFGETWRVKRSSNEGIARYVFIDDREGWACGIVADTGVLWSGKDLLMHTTDGGLNWVEQLNEYIEPTFGLANIDFYDKNRGVAAGGLGKLLITSDGGRNWENISMDPDRVTGFWGVSFPTSNTAFLAGGNGTVVKLTFEASSVAEGEAGEESMVVVQEGDYLRIRFPSNLRGPGSVQLYDVRGQSVSEPAILTDDELRMPIGPLSSGVYFLTAHLDDRELRSRVVIAR